MDEQPIFFLLLDTTANTLILDSSLPLSGRSKFLDLLLLTARSGRPNLFDERQIPTQLGRSDLFIYRILD